ncbi:MAG: peptidylprolyl isomerase [Nitrososphaerota archaeon]
MHFKIFTISLIVILLASSIPQNFADSKVAVIETKFGNMTVEFFPQDAPKTVENFIKLAESGFYDGVKFHRIISGFMIQGGDPLSKDNNMTQQWGTGNAGYNIDAEFNNIKHKRGIISMARAADPNSASSQFFIVHQDSTFLDGAYTVFGRLITQESYDVLDKIASLETNRDPASGAAADSPLNYEDAEIRSIKIINYSELPNPLNLGDPERIITHSILDEKGNYNSTAFEFSFHAPEGWVAQEPQKTRPEIPDIVLVGPTTDGFTPVISFLIEDKHNTSLENHIKDTRKNIQKLIDDGKLEILSEKTNDIKGYNAHVTDAKGSFVINDRLFHLKYKEIIIKSGDKFYTITYANQEKNFDANLSTFDAVVDSFETTSKPKEDMTQTSAPGGGCLIATAAFGSDLAPQVQLLRETRDNILMKTYSGTAFMTVFNQFYYSFSSTVAQWERENPIFKEIVKVTITPLISSLSILNYVNIDSEAHMVGYGIGIILLNVGMYFVVPVFVIYRLKK